MDRGKKLCRYCWRTRHEAYYYRKSAGCYYKVGDICVRCAKYCFHYKAIRWTEVYRRIYGEKWI